MSEWIVSGTATVSVCVTVEARSAKEALRKARAATSAEWTCDEVDGEVEISEDEARQKAEWWR